ncbi:MAG: ABC transporter permease subunit [Thermoleophilaceae bacterium]
MSEAVADSPPRSVSDEAVAPSQRDLDLAPRVPLGTAGVWGLRLGILAAVLLSWQFLPQIGWLRERSPVFDPFFVSSPSLVFDRLVDMATGADGQPTVWPFLWDTLQGTFLGVAIGTLLGALFGLLLSNSATSRRVLSPYVTVLNATPRIALIPIFVIIAGPTLTASVLTAVAVVFFLVFYNAFAGGVSVPQQTVQNARLLGASRAEVMRQVRLPYVMVWTFASLPNAISFGLVAVVTAEILTGRLGMGRLLFNSISSVDSTLTFCVVIVLSVVGVLLVTISDAVQKRVLHWWEGSV